MAAIENLMRRWGFVRLSRYGLVLTPEGRIMSLRPEVLDDGMGGKIVGWRDRDLAAAELARFEMPAAVKAVASPVATPAPTAIRVSPPVAASTISPLVPAPRAVAVAVPLASPTSIARPLPPIPKPAPPITRPFVAVAPVAEPEEDEWEWEIALARARAVEDVIVRPSQPSRRMRADTVPPAISAAKTDLGIALPKKPSLPKFIDSKTLPMAGAKADPIQSGEWPKTEPLGTIDYNDQTNPMSEVVRVVRLHQAAKPAAKIPAKETPHPRVFVRAPSPTTVIPVPKLPRVTNQTIEPVVRTRFPSATPVPARTTQRPFIAPPPPVRPAEDDKTSPGMLSIPATALPRIPSIVKRAR
jgi:hypothetical protein